MTNDIDLDELERRSHRSGAMPSPMVRVLIAAVRSERARAEKAEQGSAYWNRRFAEEHARALAAEPFMQAMEGVTADTIDFAALCVSRRVTEGSDEEPTQEAALEWLNRLADQLRAQDEPKRCNDCGGTGRGDEDEPLTALCETCLGSGTKDEPKREPGGGGS